MKKQKNARTKGEAYLEGRSPNTNLPRGPRKFYGNESVKDPEAFRYYLNLYRDHRYVPRKFWDFFQLEQIPREAKRKAPTIVAEMASKSAPKTPQVWIQKRKKTVLDSAIIMFFVGAASPIVVIKVAELIVANAP
jgi:hypothetical protein